MSQQTGPQGHPKYRRRLRNYLFLDKPVQISIAVTLALAGTLGGLLFLGGFTLYSRGLLDTLQHTAYAPGATEVVREALLVQQELFVQAAALYLVVICGGLFVFGLLYSHRIAGPLYRMHETMRAVCSGHIPGPVRFRRYDLLRPMERRINEMLQVLREDRQSRREDLEQILELVQGGEEQRAEAARIIEDLIVRHDDGAGTPAPEKATATAA